MARPKAETKNGTATAKVAVPASIAPAGPALPPRRKAAKKKKPEPPPNPAAWMHERLAHQIVEFEKNLGPDHEIGGRFVQGPGEEPLHISNVASWGPDMILFIGEFQDGRRFELMQHYSQVNMLLVAVPKMRAEPRRIGFDVVQGIDNPVLDWEDPVS